MMAFAYAVVKLVWSKATITITIIVIIMIKLMIIIGCKKTATKKLKN